MYFISGILVSGDVKARDSEYRYHTGSDTYSF
jgi:hypothetical protein